MIEMILRESSLTNLVLGVFYLVSTERAVLVVRCVCACYVGKMLLRGSRSSAVSHHELPRATRLAHWLVVVPTIAPKRKRDLTPLCSDTGEIANGIFVISDFCHLRQKPVHRLALIQLCSSKEKLAGAI